MSEIRANTISDAAGTGPVTLTGQYAAKAWVNFNGTGTVAVRDSENVSSLTDTTTGQYLANLSNAMSSANFSTPACAGDAGNAGVIGGQQSQTATAISVMVVSRVDSVGFVDVAFVFAAAHGDLA